MVLSLPDTACSRMESTCSRTCNTEPLHEGISFPIPPWRTAALQQKEPHAKELEHAKEYTAALQDAKETCRIAAALGDQEKMQGEKNIFHKGGALR